MKLILARHGETRLNEERRFQGIDDEPLNDTGRKQALALAEAIAKDAPLHLYASPLRRTMETAQPISERLDIPINPIKSLQEMDIGELSGLSGQEMRERYPEFTRSWADNPATAQLPGGETMEDVQNRAWLAIKEIWEKHPQDTVLVVSHNFTILSIIAKALDMNLRSFRRLRQDLCGISRIELDDSRILLTSLNETWHLQ